MTAADNRVAVVVFLTVHDGDDLAERQITADRAVHQALSAAGSRDGGRLTLLARFPDATESAVTVNGHMELGRAMRSGYVWAHPTADAYPRETS
ncbi:hypothetical protein [Saccharopolyspora taberi]|uniref:YCII-related domain-containing protein n=1 Tax=Saccharopolyspora taberi TaxID=60895 RepID=A0ABN3UZN3_9PSEU